MWKLVVVLTLVEYAIGGIFDFTEFDDPYNANNYFFNRPAVIIRQHHGRCLTNVGGNNQEGICLTRPECTLSGGQPSGAQNCLLGTCCVYANGCNKVTRKRVSYFEGSTQNDASVCTYRVEAENINICQMRLDFDSLNLPDPRRDLTPVPDPQNAGGTISIPTGPYTCRDAFFQVESPNVNGRIPTLCGDNNGQHIYVPVNASRGERELVIKVVNNLLNVNNNNANGVNWKIKVTQIECPGLGKHQKSLRVWEDALLRAPDGCLQYWQAPSGTIRNLGFNPASTAASFTSNHYESNLNYAVCFRRTNDMCGIDFNFNQFQLGSVYNQAATPPSYCSMPVSVTIDQNGQPVSSTIYRDTDFLYIPNGVHTVVDNNTLVATTNFQSRYCGWYSPNTVVRSVTPGPFYIFFKTDNQVLDNTNTVYPNPNNLQTPVNPDPENGWQITYTSLYGNTCGNTI